jgi:hypothetical protein
MDIPFQYHNATTNDIFSIFAVECTSSTMDIMPSSVNKVPSTVAAYVSHITLETFPSSHSLLHSRKFYKN